MRCNRFTAYLMTGILMLATGCMTLEPDELLGSQWVLQSINDESDAWEHAPTLNFGERADLSGNGGCNGFTARYSSRVDGFSIEKVSSTRKMCAAERMTLEREYFSLLRETAHLGGESGKLLLTTKNGDRLVFRKK